MIAKLDEGKEPLATPRSSVNTLGHSATGRRATRS